MSISHKISYSVLKQLLYIITTKDKQMPTRLRVCLAGYHHVIN
ncbi:hypothetical protein [Sulfurimonas sp.]